MSLAVEVVQGQSAGERKTRSEDRNRCVIAKVIHGWSTWEKEVQGKEWEWQQDVGGGKWQGIALRLKCPNIEGCVSKCQQTWVYMELEGLWSSIEAEARTGVWGQDWGERVMQGHTHTQWLNKQEYGIQTHLLGVAYSFSSTSSILHDVCMSGDETWTAYKAEIDESAATNYEYHSVW